MKSVNALDKKGSDQEDVCGVCGEEGYLNAMGQPGRCFACGEYGHHKFECPHIASKGKGKGKDAGGTNAKGNGKT